MQIIRTKLVQISTTLHKTIMKENIYKINLVLLLFIFLNIATTTEIQAQDDKKLEKEWKAKRDAYSPLDFKKLIYDKNATKITVDKRAAELEDNKKAMLTKDDEIAELKAQKKKLLKANEEVDASPKSTKGIVFKVQIGAYKNIEIPAAFLKETQLETEKDGKNVKKYTLGQFKDYWAADKFKKLLWLQGMKDAFIVAYKDGKRIGIKEALEGIV